MASEYTPTTEQVRAALNGWDDRLDFDAWLAAEKAQAWYEGSVIGYDCGRVDERMFHAYAVPTNNPYRSGTVRLSESDQRHT